jgi:short-subunit dehydrogenase
MAYSYTFLEYFLFGNSHVNKQKLKAAIQYKTILITGASFGIGESLARLLAPTGAKLILVARTQSKLELLQNELQKEGAIVEIYALDLTNKEAVAQWLKALNFDIDIIVSNAGKSIKRSIYQSLYRLHDFERTMALNYFAPVQIILDLIPKLEKRKGHIVNISAVNTLLIPAPYWAAYQSSKTAFDQWFRSVSPELKAKGIDLTTVYLPLVKTRMIAPTKAYQHVPAMSPQHVAHIIAKSLLTKQTKHQPWWLIFGQIGSLFFRRPWEFFATKWIQKQNKKDV